MCMIMGVPFVRNNRMGWGTGVLSALSVAAVGLLVVGDGGGLMLRKGLAE